MPLDHPLAQGLQAIFTHPLAASDGVNPRALTPLGTRKVEEHPLFPPAKLLPKAMTGGPGKVGEGELQDGPRPSCEPHAQHGELEEEPRARGRDLGRCEHTSYVPPPGYAAVGWPLC